MVSITSTENSTRKLPLSSVAGLPVPDVTALETHAVLKACIEARVSLAGFVGMLGRLRQRVAFAEGSLLLDAVGALQLSGKPEPAQRRLLIDPHTHDDLAGCYIAGIKSVLRDSEPLISGNTSMALATRLYQGETRLRSTELSARERIGVSGDARIVAVEQVPDEFSRWHRFLDEKCQSIDPLIRLAIAHAGWSLLRPLERGNVLVQQAWTHVLLEDAELCPTPCLPLAYQFNQQAEEYWQAQRQLADNNQWEPFLLFVLKAVCVAAEERQRAAGGWQRAVDMLALELEQAVSAPVAAGVVKLACQRSLSAADLITSSTVERSAAQTFVRDLVGMGAFTELETATGKRFYHEPLINALLLAH